MITHAYRQRLLARRAVLLRSVESAPVGAAEIPRDDTGNGPTGRAAADGVRHRARRVEEEIGRIDAILGRP